MLNIKKTLIMLIALSCIGFAGSFAFAESAKTRLSYEDQSDILDLMARYGQYVDGGEGEAWASLFTPDGELNFPGNDASAPRMSIKGHDALVAAVKGWTAGHNGKVRIHGTADPILVKMDATHVRARTPALYAMIDLPHTRTPTIDGYAIYEDDIVKTAKGWRFARRYANVYGQEPIPPEFLKFDR